MISTKSIKDVEKVLELNSTFNRTSCLIEIKSWKRDLEISDLPIDFLKAWVSASVFDISREKISEPASIVNGVSSPRLFAMPILYQRKKKVSEKLTEELKSSWLKRLSLKLESRLENVPEKALLNNERNLRDSSLSCTWLTSDKDGSTSNLSFPDHAKDYTCGSSCFDLHIAILWASLLQSEFSVCFL